MLCGSIGKGMPEHLHEVRERKLALLTKTEGRCQRSADQGDQLLGPRAVQMKKQERAGKAIARLSSGVARKHADEL